MPAKPRVLKKRSEALQDKINEVKKSAEQKAIERESHLKQCFNEVAGSESGRVIFRELARLCSLRKSKVVADMQSRTIDPISTMFNCAQENIYLQMTKRVRREHLLKIEYPFLKQPE